MFEALAASRTLAGRLIFKGARVLSRRLGGANRASYDIDLNLTTQFTADYPTRVAQRDALHAEIFVALTHHFEDQDVVRYVVDRVTVQPKPRTDHPMGWNAYEVRLALRDTERSGVLGLPTLQLDVAAPEALGPGAVAPLAVGEHEVTAYTLERIAGEKLRAFLTSLPAYRAKMTRPGEGVRAKDLYDLARILDVHPLSDAPFWRTALREFRLACASRYVDCAGLTSFTEQVGVTRAAYETDATIPNDVAWEQALAGLTRVARQLEADGICPFVSPLPPPDRRG